MKYNISRRMAKDYQGEYWEGESTIRTDRLRTVQKLITSWKAARTTLEIFVHDEDGDLLYSFEHGKQEIYKKDGSLTIFWERMGK